MGIKLNLGCGDDIREGYVNVDFRKTHPEVYECDLSRFPWPWDADEADEILMLDFLEHFPYACTSFILLECYRVLRPGGEVVIQVPDAVQLTHAISQRGMFFCNRCGNPMNEGDSACAKCGLTADEISEAAMRRLYGGQDYPGNYHHTCLTPRMLELKATGCGLSFDRYEEAHHQALNWNYKAVYRKGELW